MAQRPAVIFRRFGAYHVARLNALARHSEAVLGLEICAIDQTYSWDLQNGHSFVRRTLFPREQDISYEQLKVRLTKALDEWRPDFLAIPGWGFAEGLLGLRWALQNEVPCIIMSDSRASDERRHPIKELLKSLVVRSASAGLVAGEEHKNYLMSLGMPRDYIATGFDVVDNAHFYKGALAARNDPLSREKLGLPDNYFLYLGRFVKKKNLVTLLEAYNDYRSQEIAANRRPSNLLLTGNGPLRNEITRISGEGVHFRDFATYEQLPALLGLAQGLILPSRIDQWGLVVNEAMAAGCPPVVSIRAGAAELVKDGLNGFLVEPDRAGLATGLAKLAQADREALGLRAQETIAHWSPERFALTLLKLAKPRNVRSRLWARFCRPLIPMLAKRAVRHAET